MKSKNKSKNKILEKFCGCYVDERRLSLPFEDDREQCKLRAIKVQKQNLNFNF